MTIFTTFEIESIEHMNVGFLASNDIVLWSRTISTSTNTNLKWKIISLEKLVKTYGINKFKIIEKQFHSNLESSTCAPGGNQVDDLPLASSLL